MSGRNSRSANRSVPGIGGAPSDERSADGQQALRLHAGISVVAFVLCAFVCGIFVWLGSVPLAIVFGVLALGCLGALGWATARRNRGRRDHFRPRR